MPPSKELLFRQIPKHNWDPIAQRPSSMAFGPATIDQGMPSFSRSTKATAQQSRDWHQHNARSASMGVWACSAQKVTAAETRSVDDTECPVDSRNPRSPGHCYVDYRQHVKREERAVRAFLLADALERGEIPTVECEACSRFAMLGTDEIAALRDEAKQWVSFNGRRPESSSEDPVERHQAQTLVHIRNIGDGQKNGGTQE